MRVKLSYTVDEKDVLAEAAKMLNLAADDMKQGIALFNDVQVELRGENKKCNRIFLCPNHHTKVFIPESKSGIHTVKGKDSIILKGWLQSTGGMILNYIDQDGKEQYYDKS